MIVALSLWAGLMAAAPSEAPNAPQAQPAAAAAKPDPGVVVTAKSDDQVVTCKSIAVTGTRFPTRQCRTKAEWDGMAASAREFVDKASRPACTSGCKSPG
jgi:hypothetical protein